MTRRPTTRPMHGTAHMAGVILGWAFLLLVAVLLIGVAAALARLLLWAVWSV